MKNKLFGLFITFFMLLTIPVYSSDIEVQPTMFSRSNEQDRVWVGTFQIVWNEFIDKYVHSPIRFREGTPASAQELNLRSFNSSNLSEKYYYKFSGNITKTTGPNIKKAIKRKFDTNSDIIDKLELIPSSNNFIIYVMLKKDFEFIQSFDKLGQAAFGNNSKAEYFGINKNTDKEAKNNVKVLFYNNSKDFAVKLLSKEGDEVYLYKNPANKDFQTLYNDMNLKMAKFKGDKFFKNNDELKVPNIKFDVSKTFDELCKKRIMGTNITITKALETVKFNMDNKGVQLKSEAAMVFVESIFKEDTTKPRYFYFNDTFIIFLKEKDKPVPYFALRVNDIKKYQ